MLAQRPTGGSVTSLHLKKDLFEFEMRISIELLDTVRETKKSLGP